mmetsp:Transcript_30434/g.40195  ORF Transcript_30434/g.40195 Transcript_30434/m.40195 type:complete len:538 (+) Transcript_30434:19-1632(+)
MAETNKRIHYGALQPMERKLVSTKAQADASITAGVKAGNINIATNEQTEVVELSETSREQQDRHAQLLQRVEAEKRARSLIVPTSIAEVKKTLRAYGQPVTLFGENPAARRERLREFLARRQISQEEASQVLQETVGDTAAAGGLVPRKVTQQAGGESQSVVPGQELFYTPASKSLVEAREQIAHFSFQRGQARLTGQRRKRSESGTQEAQDHIAANLYTTVREMRINSSQFGDERPLSCLRYSPNPRYCATGSWDPAVKVWDLKTFETKVIMYGHKERTVSLAWHPEAKNFQDPNDMTDETSPPPLLATASADATAKVWNCNKGECTATLKGHEHRLSQVAFHPTGRYIGTTSFDHTWRFWDIESEEELLLQEGHSCETYAIAFQGDGALAATGDFQGIGRLWDLRSGRSIWELQGHVKRLLCADFAPNGFTLATGSDDNTVRIWDLRKKQCVYNLPAHGSLITDVKYAPTSGEFIVTSSFDATAKVWSTRNWSLLRVLAGHEGKVTACDISSTEDNIITASFDRTFKLWAHKDKF